MYTVTKEQFHQLVKAIENLEVLQSKIDKLDAWTDKVEPYIGAIHSNTDGLDKFMKDPKIARRIALAEIQELSKDDNTKAEAERKLEALKAADKEKENQMALEAKQEDIALVAANMTSFHNILAQVEKRGETFKEKLLSTYPTIYKLAQEMDVDTLSDPKKLEDKYDAIGTKYKKKELENYSKEITKFVNTADYVEAILNTEFTKTVQKLKPYQEDNNKLLNLAFAKMIEGDADSLENIVDSLGNSENLGNPTETINDLYTNLLGETNISAYTNIAATEEPKAVSIAEAAKAAINAKDQVTSNAPSSQNNDQNIKQNNTVNANTFG